MSAFSNWQPWDRMKLREISTSDLNKSEQLGELWRSLHEPSGTKQWYAHRLALLIWINEVELAQKFWQENKHQFFGDSLMETLFGLVIVRGVSSGQMHPEFERLVQYHVLPKESAFQLSTTPLSSLLKMDQPRFSSADGVIDVKFDKNELKRVADIVPLEYHGKLRLPLILFKLPPAELPATHEAIGSNLENLLLQSLLKLSSAHFGKYNEVPRINKISNLSMLARRKFKTIYTVFPELGAVFLSATYKHPDFP